MSSLRHDSSHRPAPHGSPFLAPQPAPDQGAEGGTVLSIIIPARNEASSLPQLVEEIAGAFRPLVGEREDGHRLDGFELLIVDDGSTDASAAVLGDLAGSYPELRPLIMGGNIGQSSAIAVGFRAARGCWVAILDADLQNRPVDLAMLWEAMPGYDAALGWRTKREDVWSKRVISRVANAARNAILGQGIRDTGCAVRIFPREVALRFPMFHGVHRFFGPLLIREGCRILQLPVTHRPRPHGRSHYNLFNRSIKVIVDLFGVAWLMRRPIRSRPIAPTSPSPTSAGARADVGVVADRRA